MDLKIYTENKSSKYGAIVPILSTIIQYSAQDPSRSNKTRERNKGHTIGKEEIKLSLLAVDMTLHLECPINFIRQFIDIINTSSKVTRYKISIQNKQLCYTPIINLPRKY